MTRRAPVSRSQSAVPSVQAGSRWAAPAQFYLARVALQEDRPRECVERCQRLLREPGSVARGEVLDLLGRCYTQMGEHRLAARCFAGEAPALAEEAAVRCPRVPPADPHEGGDEGASLPQVDDLHSLSPPLPCGAWRPPRP